MILTGPVAQRCPNTREDSCQCLDTLGSLEPGRYREESEHTVVERMEAENANHSASQRMVTATEGCQHELPESAKTETPVLTLNFCSHVIPQALGACVLRGFLYLLPWTLGGMQPVCKLAYPSGSNQAGEALLNP